MKQAPVPGDDARSVQTDRGFDWWRTAWLLFRQSPGTWVVLGLVSIALLVLVSLVPLVGSLVASLGSPVLAGGWMLAARKAESGGTVELADLFAGFREKFTPLLVQGAVLLAASLVTALLVGGLGASAIVSALLGGGAYSPEALMTAMSAGLMALVIGLAMSVVMAMAIWFAPALVVFRNLAPVDAMKASFSASVKNTMPFLLYSVVFLVAAIVASIPLGLGWLVLAPVMALSIYVSYREIFEA